MQPPKNPRDESDQGGGRSLKRPRAENEASNNPSMASRFTFSSRTASRGSAGNQPASGISSTPGGASLFGAAPAQPQPLRLSNPATTSWNPSQSKSSNEPKPGASQITGSLFGPGPSRPSTSGGSVPVGLVQQVTQQSARSPPVKLEGVATRSEQGSTTTAVDARPVVKLPLVSDKVEVFHEHGDLTLVAGKQGIKFRGSSQALALVSSRWQSILDGQSSGKTSQQGADSWMMQLPEDHPDALRIVLQVIHYKFDAVPTSLSLDTVFHLTVLCDKYDMVGLLKPFWVGWISKLPQPALEPRSFVQQVWIAHKLGHMQLYECVVKEFLCCVSKPGVFGTILFLDGYPNFNLSGDPHLLALGLLESWTLGRLRLIRRVKSELDAALSKLSDPRNTSCKSASSDWQMTCDCAMLGGVHRALHGKSWYSSGNRNWEDQVTCSVR